MIFHLELYLICILTIFCLLIIGKTIIAVFDSRFQNNSIFYLKFFYEIVMGFIFITVIKSVITTQGKSLNILFVLPFLFFVAEKVIDKKNIISKNISIQFNFNKNYLYLWAVFTIIFILNACFLFSFTGAFKLPSQDLFFYSKISNALAFYGKENLLFSANDPIFSNQPGIVLYHFFDLWFNTIFIDLGLFSAYISLYFITIPLLVFALYLGIVALWAQFGIVTPFKLLVSILLIFTCAVTYKFYDHFIYMQNTIPGFTNTMPFSYFGRKLVIVYIFALLIANLFVAGKKHLAIQVILLTAVVYSSGTFIGLFGGMLLFFLFSIIFNKKHYPLFEIENRSKFFIVLFICIFLLFSYVNRQADFYDSFADQSLLHLKWNIDYFSKIKLAFGVVFYALLFIGFGYFLYFLIFLYNTSLIKSRLNNLSQYFLIVGLALLVGLMGLFIFYTQLNARQFLTNLFPFVNVMCLAIIIIVIEGFLSSKNWSYQIILSLLFFIFISYENIKIAFTSQLYPNLNALYSANFRYSAKSMLQSFDTNILIGYCSADTAAKYNYPFFSKWTFLDIWGYNNLVEVPVSPTLMQMNRATFKNNPTFTDLMNSTMDSETFKLKFIKLARLKVIVADTIQTFIPNNSIQSMAYDSISHECIYVLKQ